MSGCSCLQGEARAASSQAEFCSAEGAEAAQEITPVTAPFHSLCRVQHPQGGRSGSVASLLLPSVQWVEGTKDLGTLVLGQLLFFILFY